MAKNEVAKVNDNAQLPAYLQDIQNAGGQIDNDNFDSSDVTIPQIKLLQGTSEQVTTFDNAQAGNFWHTGMDMDLGNSIEFIVCFRKKKFLLQAPMLDGKGVLARAEDAKTWDRMGEWPIKLSKVKGHETTWAITDLDVEASGMAQWGSSDPNDENSPPAATLFYEYLVILPDSQELLDLGPAVVSLARSAVKKAKKGLNDKIAMHKSNGRPVQALKFKATVMSETNDDGQDYYNWNFTGAGFVLDEELFKKATELGGILQDYKVQDEGADDEGGAKSSAATDAAAADAGI